MHRVHHASHRLMALFSTLLSIGLAASTGHVSAWGDETKEADTLQEGIDDEVTLSVAPMDHVQYPPDRPNWIDDDPIIESDSASIVAYSGIQDTEAAADDMLEVMTTAAVETVVRHRLDSVTQSIDPEQVQLDRRWIEDRIVVRRYAGEATIGGETKYECAVLLRLSGEENQVIAEAIANAQIAERLAVVGIASLGGFACLVGGSVVFGGLSRRRSNRKPASP